MNFKLLRVSGVQRIDDGAFIPNDGGNLDWQAYQAWLAAGNTPLPADPAPVPLDQSDINNLEKRDKALALLTRKYANDLKAGTYVAKTVADTRSDFMSIFQALP